MILFQLITKRKMPYLKVAGMEISVEGIEFVLPKKNEGLVEDLKIYGELKIDL